MKLLGFIQQWKHMEALSVWLFYKLCGNVFIARTKSADCESAYTRHMIYCVYWNTVQLINKMNRAETIKLVQKDFIWVEQFNASKV